MFDKILKHFCSHRSDTCRSTAVLDQKSLYQSNSIAIFNRSVNYWALEVTLKQLPGGDQYLGNLAGVQYPLGFGPIPDTGNYNNQ